MAVSQLPQAPYRQDRRIYPTPDSGDVLFSEVRDCTRSEIPEYGTPHPNPKKWPDHKLVFVKTVDIERDGIFEFFYAADRENQDLYNFSVGYRNIIGNAGGREFRVVQRSYVTPRADFQPLDIPFGTPMPNVPEGKFDDIEYVFFDRQQQPIDQQELNSLYVAEVHTYVEKAFLDDKLSYTAQRNDPLPEKFQILVPEQVVEQIVDGKAEMPVLTGPELSVKEDQLNPDVKLVRTTSRDRSTLPVSLYQKTTTNDKQLASITQTVQSGDTLEEPSATVNIESQALGDGTYVVTKTEVPELFTAEFYSAERPDLVPEIFRAIVPTTTEEASEIGTAEPPTLETGELAVTEQQQNKFVKRKRTTKRDITVLPKSLTRTATTGDKQLATITETLQVGDTTEQPSALVDIESRALGDGTYVVQKSQVPELFPAKVYSVEKPDTVPERFKAQNDFLTTSETTNKIGEPTPPSLAAGELSRTNQQLNEFVFKEQVVKRPNVSNVSLPQVQRAYVEGTVAKVDEKLSTSPTIESGLLVSESSATPIGDGKFIVETVKVDSWPQLKSSEWVPTIEAQVVRTEQMVSPPATFNEPNTSYKSINKDRALKITEEIPTAALDNYLISLPTRTDLQIPPVLKSITADWTRDESVSDGDTEGSGVMPSGDGVSLSADARSIGKAQYGATPSVVVNIENVQGSDIPATLYFFYLKSTNGSVSEGQFLSRLSSLVGSVQKWPVFKPQTHTIVAKGATVTANAQAAVSQTKIVTLDGEAGLTQSVTEEFTWGINRTFEAININNCIHGSITISNATAVTSISATASASARLTGDFDLSATKVQSVNSPVSVFPTSLPATSPADVPRSGKYVISSRAEPFKWGYVKCTAIVVDASNFA